ncbi:hypothetical protein [Croceimicrobium hydrocarbonivorans]|uniref:Uncharacterized protein n=1 Tax=Croceimicrobium hydrocarbonivorans TaxID=2761580 RepID=A0A7H0VFU3_9FLAO|nr:hypothetical protein [Croceimicrobium hydrocarbonivorans]QNR24591.1 hypothetical protein H4K34_01750 [Croceimicrobium hydrocarbonivorans]
MISILRNSKALSLLWGIMAFYLLNISVDTRDFQANDIPEDLSFNDQESMVEIIVEQILGYEDAFIEYDDPDTEESQSQNSLKIEALINPYLFIGKPLFIDESLMAFSTFFAGTLPGHFNIDNPPPQA